MNVPIEKWGKDHWSAFAYLCARVTGNAGVPNKDHMRTDQDLHPALVGPRSLIRSGLFTKYPTRLNDKTEQENHDDWSCVDDFETEGLVEIRGTGIEPIWALTPKGWAFNKALTDFKGKGGNFAGFKASMVDYAK